MISPAIDKPLGDLNTPIKLSNAPKNHNNHHKTGIHHKNNANKANTKPAVPTPLLHHAFTYTTCVLPPSFFSTFVITIRIKK